MAWGRRREAAVRRIQRQFHVGVPGDRDRDPRRVDKKIAAVRLQSHPLTDKGGAEYRQHCAWFVYFNDDNKITRVVDYSDTKLVDEMILRVHTTKMKELQ